MRSTFRILFYPKKGAPLKNGKLPIMLRITIDGDKVEFSTKLEIEEKKWDTRTGKVSGRTPVANEMNLKLDRIRVELNSHYDKFREAGSYPTPLMLKNAYLGIQAKSHTMLTIFKKIVDEKKKLLGVSIVKSTCDKYELVYHRLQEYIKQEYQNNDLPLSSIDDDFVNGFERFLRAGKEAQKEKEGRNKAMIEYEEPKNDIDRYLMERFKYRRSLVYLTVDNVITTRRNIRIDLYLRIRKVKSLFPPDCLIIVRLGFSKEQTGHGTHFVRFLTGIALKYGFRYVGIECANSKSSAFAKKLGFYSIDGENLAITVSNLMFYFSME